MTAVIPFSLRMFHCSWGLMSIHQNIAARPTLLDFPTRERFVRTPARAAYVRRTAGVEATLELVGSPGTRGV